MQGNKDYKQHLKYPITKTNMKGDADYDTVLNTIGDGCLFFIELSSDKQIVVYEANRVGNVLKEPFVDVYWSNFKNLTDREELSEKVKRLFFGVQVKIEKGLYKMFIASLPSKIVTLHLKTSGKVVAKSIINGKEARVYKIFVNVNNSILGLPVVKSLIIYGEHKKRLVSEEIHITDNIRKKFDMSNLVF